MNRLQQPVILYQSIAYPTVEKIEYQEIDKPILYARFPIEFNDLFNPVIAKNTIAREVL